MGELERVDILHTQPSEAYTQSWRTVTFPICHTLPTLKFLLKGQVRVGTCPQPVQMREVPR